MNPKAPTIDKTFRRYADLLLEHHRLLSGGKDDAADTEAVEEEMSRLWEQLDAAQRSSLSGLGSDLNWLRRHAAPAPKARTAADITDSQALASALKSSDWHTALHFLRACAPQVPVLEQATIRSTAWSQLGFADVARTFAEFAKEMEGEAVG
jgi:hypothetical protein